MDNTTAKVSCFARAYHFENNKTHIFADSMAKKVLGDDYDHIAKSMMQGIDFFLPGFEGTKEEGLRLIVDKQLSPYVLGRSAYCERKLLDKIKNGFGRLISGVHWATDIIGSVLLSTGLFMLYRFAVLYTDKAKKADRSKDGI